MNEHNALADGLDLQHLPVLQKGPWTMVGQDLRRQGWKLHISCTPDLATPLLGRRAPLLDARRTPFKFARSLLVLENINAGQFGHTQVGKFITVYPRGDELSAGLALVTGLGWRLSWATPSSTGRSGSPCT